MPPRDCIFASFFPPLSLMLKPAKKKVKLLLTRLPARSTKKLGAAILDDDSDIHFVSDEDGTILVDPGLDDMDSDESGPGEQDSGEEEEDELEEGSDQETAMADEEPSPVVSRNLKRKRTKASGEHL
jgi:hypothetical protein